MGVQQRNVVSCHNDTLACTTSMLPDCFTCVWNCVMCLVVPAAACLLILGCLGAIIIAQCAQ